MSDNILVFYGSYRSDRMGVRLADYIVSKLRARGDNAEFIDAKAVGLPMLDRMYKEYPKGTAPAAMEALAEKIRAADAFVFVTGEYNWGPQPGLKNLTDHFLEEWFLATRGRGELFGGALLGRALGHGVALDFVGDGHGRGLEHAGHRADLADAGRRRPASGPAGESLDRSFGRFADDLAWWTEAARAQRARKAPPY
jgi:NAD(P)H-dependent FMN reductase